MRHYPPPGGFYPPPNFYGQYSPYSYPPHFYPQPPIPEQVYPSEAHSKVAFMPPANHSVSHSTATSSSESMIVSRNVAVIGNHAAFRKVQTSVSNSEKAAVPQFGFAQVRQQMRSPESAAQNSNAFHSLKEEETAMEDGAEQDNREADDEQLRGSVVTKSESETDPGLVSPNSETAETKPDERLQEESRATFPDGAAMPNQSEDIERVQTMFSLNFEKIYGESLLESRIRVWKEIETGVKFYDCTCGGRKPSRSLTKIQDHAKGHDVKFRQCPHCTKQFTSYRSLNAHKRAHKDVLEAEREARKLRAVESAQTRSYFEPQEPAPDSPQETHHEVSMDNRELERSPRNSFERQEEAAEEEVDVAPLSPNSQVQVQLQHPPIGLQSMQVHTSHRIIATSQPTADAPLVSTSSPERSHSITDAPSYPSNHVQVATTGQMYDSTAASNSSSHYSSQHYPSVYNTSPNQEPLEPRTQ
jgi:hypothetical protein